MPIVEVGDSILSAGSALEMSSTAYLLCMISAIVGLMLVPRSLSAAGLLPTVMGFYLLVVLFVLAATLIAHLALVALAASREAAAMRHVVGATLAGERLPNSELSPVDSFLNRHLRGPT